MSHLGIVASATSPEFVYADPDNAAYDALDLNRSFMTPATAFSFRDRIFGGKMGEIYEVLGKWKDAVYVPPKLGQAFNQGGTFVLNHDQRAVVFAHYDEAVGAHAEHDYVTELATAEATKQTRSVL